MAVSRSAWVTGALVLLVGGLAGMTACGPPPEEPLPEVCGVELPPPTYGESPVEPETEPATPPYREVTYHWPCVDGYLVEETWIRNENDCWIKDGEYRRENPWCAETATAPGDSEALLLVPMGP